ncbi:hypothetical protein Q9233_009690 [Columba guinea]|nr:hypothetical protein Q9233_009690 [Columba guinea]
MMAAAPIQQNGTHTGVPIDLDPPDSRKRPLEAPPEAGSTKRTNTGEDGQYFLKVLIPSYAAGSIIGKGGQTIVQLQKETGATIKLSKSKDFYPGFDCEKTKHLFFIIDLSLHPAGPVISALTGSDEKYNRCVDIFLRITQGKLRNLTGEVILQMLKIISLSLIENLDVDDKELYSKKILYEMIAEDQDSRSSMQSAPAVCNNHTVIT